MRSVEASIFGIWNRATALVVEKFSARGLTIKRNLERSGNQISNVNADVIKCMEILGYTHRGARKQNEKLR